MNLILRYAIRFRFGQYLYREFGGRSSDIYPCVTCGLPYNVDEVD